MIGLRRGLVRGARISALGVYVPPRVLTNEEISQTLDTSDEWILTRTGIRERRIADPDQAASDLGVVAADRCLESVDFDPRDLDLVIVTTISPDHIMPATASILADKIGATRAGAFDVQAGCTGFVYGLAIATAFVSANIYKNVLVVGAEVLSKMVDWEDRSTCILFGDGAGAVLVQPTDNGSIFSFDLGNDGSGAPNLLVPAGGSRLPASEETVAQHLHAMHMTGSEVFKFATRTVVDSCTKVLGDAALGVEDVDLFVPHQANIRIIERVAQKLGFTDAQVFANLDRYGNTSCASIPICLHEAKRDGRLKKGDMLLMAGFGAGLTWGSCLTKWELLRTPVDNLVLLFPGQGSQALGMGLDLSATDRLMRATYAEASEVLGWDLEALLAGDDAELLNRTDKAQPALLANSVGIFRLLLRDGLHFDVALGHSLGEYSALVATGAVSFADALRLVRRRGEEMLAAVQTTPSGMAAVIGMKDAAVEALCAELDGVWPANFNSPGQVVVSGTTVGLEQLTEAAKAAGAKRVIPLKVSGAFHSPVIEPALEPLRLELEKAAWHTPQPRFFSVCSLEYEDGGFMELLQRQLVSPVRFTQAVNSLYAAGYDKYLEVGPGSVLGGLVRRIAPQSTVARVSDAETLAAVREDGRYLEAS